MHNIKGQEQKYTFFFRPQSKFGFCSNFYKSNIEIVSHGAIRRYNCLEQGFMHEKALLFGDIVTSEKIMAIPFTPYAPKQYKDLGREIKNFSQSVWDKNKHTIVYNLCYNKFKQNLYIRKLLLKTEGLLVEASPYDRIWGIGLSEEDAIKTPSNRWRGSNMLGSILTSVREELKAEEKNVSKI